MHRIAAMPGGWKQDAEGVIFLDQTPAPIVFLTVADTEIQALSRACASLPEAMPEIRTANLLQLQQQLSIDAYAEMVLQHAQIMILRLLGGRAYWNYGLEVLRETAEQTGAALIVLPGDDQVDAELISHSTAPLAIANQLWRYLQEGGPDNLANGLMALCDQLLDTTFRPPGPVEVAKVGRYRDAGTRGRGDGGTRGHREDRAVFISHSSPTAAILFYRAHYLAGNTAPIDALAAGLESQGIMPLPIYVSSLQDPEVQADLIERLQGVDVLLNTTSFSVAKLDSGAPQLSLWERLDVPVLQVIFSTGPQESWAQHPLGLSPRDIAMNVALPEVDGRIISRAVSFKETAHRDTGLEADVVTYAPMADRIAFVAELAARWVHLRRTPAAQRRIALVLANYPTRDGRLANGVGLDTPQSCLEILRSLQQAGYAVGDIPDSGDDLIHWLTEGITNDPEGLAFRNVRQTLSIEDYLTFFETLSQPVQTGICNRWGPPESCLNQQTSDISPPSPPLPHSSTLPLPSFPIPGIQLGNLFIGIQPSRGYDADPALNYHAPDLEPTHDYLAFYGWLRNVFQAQAIVHVGKHGNLEWLPGKGTALSSDCYPEAAFGPMPHLYPFIVNDPGEGAQAKRRTQAVIIDHLTPPLTRAELYGPLQQIEALVDEYYEAQNLDPTRLPVISDRLLKLLRESHLLEELGCGDMATREGGDTGTRRGGGDGEGGSDSAFCLLPSAFPSPSAPSLSSLLPTLDGYLCELKEAQIRDGLHVFGCAPSGRQLRDLAVAIVRHPSPGCLGLTRAIARTWQLEIDPLTDDPAQPWQPSIHHPIVLKSCRNIGDVIEALEVEAARLVEAAISDLPPHPSPLIPDLHSLRTRILPALAQTPQELAYLLRGLEGRYVPSGPAGAPTRNRPDVLPTGRNFYSVDIRAIPTESAWDVGRRAAETLIERYTQEHGAFPRSLGLSVWGTATMRTGGDDIAEALALLGVRPIWDGPSRRVVDFETLPLSVLGRPRVDVMLRISGFFRDAFANLIDLFDQATAAIAALPEPPDQNPLAALTAEETQYWIQQGLPSDQASRRASFRVFGSKPGAYGAGLQGLIDAQNWESDADLAKAYVNWSCYAYDRTGRAYAAPESFSQRLKGIQVVLHNQDNREHDLLDSDDYYQFQGGLTAAVRSAQGQQPTVYFGDHALPENPKVRSLPEEIARVYRSRVVNPKWIAGVMRHGYKGAFEMAATVDYLFAYDATAHCIADHMYQGVAQAYVLEPQVQAFLRRSNPWALRDMAERLLEANQRGLWQAEAALLDQLRQAANQAEGILESRQSSF